jgi:hypothetical protein
VVATVSPRWCGDDASAVPLTTSTRRVHGGRWRRSLRRLDIGGPHAEPEDFERCLVLLDEAIARAERWCRQRERELADLDLRAAETVRCLRNAGMLASSTRWEPA